MSQYREPAPLLRVVPGVARYLAVCLVAGSLAAPFCRAAPMEPALAAPIPAPAQASPPAPIASFGHSGLKTATYEIGNAVDNFIFLSAGTGSLFGGVLLTSFNTLQSWSVYTTNDYLWQKFYPPTPKTDPNAAFDVKQSAWHTTLKYMTGKPVVASIKIAALYVYTGSIATAFGYGIAATAGASVVFFVNNLAWDYFDQRVAPGPVAAPVQVMAPGSAQMPTKRAAF
jgi:uncharacterized membrane protein